MSSQANRLKSLSTLGKFKLLLKDSFFFGGLSAFTKFFSIFLTPILTRLLDKQQYGSIDILTPLIGIGATIVICGMDSAVGRFYYYKESDDYRKDVISNGFLIQIAMAALVSSVLFAFSEDILRFYLGDSYQAIQTINLKVIAILVFLLTPIKYAQNLLIWTYRRRQYLILSMGFVTFNFISIVTALYFIEDKVLSFFIGQLPPAFLFTLLSIYFIRKDFRFKVNKQLLFKMLYYGAPLVVVALVPALIPSLDRYFVNKSLGLSEVATYGLGFRIATLVAIPIMSINTALGPFIYAQYKEQNSDKLFDLLISLIIILISVFIMIVALFAPLLISLFATKAYLNSLVVIVPLGFYFLIDMLKSIGAVGIDLSMKTYWNLILYPISMVVLYLLLWFLTPLYGIVGTSTALAISATINFIIFSFTGMKLYKFRFSLLKKILTLVLCFATTNLIVYTMTNFSLWVPLLIVLFFIIGCYFLLFNNNDRNKVQEMLKFKWAKK